MYKVDYTNRFLKDLKLIKKRSLKDFSLVANFIENELAVKGAIGLDKKYKAINFQVTTTTIGNVI